MFPLHTTSDTKMFGTNLEVEVEIQELFPVHTTSVTKVFGTKLEVEVEV